MRATGVMHPTDGPYVPPDTVQTLLLAGGVAQAFSWVSSGSTDVANAAAAGAHIVRLTGFTTASGPLPFMANLMSAGAAAPASGSSVASSGTNHPVFGPTMFQVPGDSTGWSAFALTSGYVICEQWRK